MQNNSFMVERCDSMCPKCGGPEIKASIVVPVYNVEKYLQKCLDSVANQTLQNIEIIVVDDGSTDSCGRICDGYAANDPRFLVIHKRNEGYGKAVNVGIAHASGKYIGIVESDDEVLPDMYETLLRVIEENGLDFVKSDYFEVRNTHRRLMHSSGLEGYYNKILGPEQRGIFYLFPIANWSGLYSRDFIVSHNIAHNETPGASYQDTGFWMQIMSLCGRCMWIDRAFYLYCQDNPNSSVKSKYKMTALQKEYDFAETALRENGLVNELKYCAYYRLHGGYGTFFRIDDSIKRAYADVLIDNYKKYKNLVPNEYKKNSASLFEWYDTLSANPDQLCGAVIGVNLASRKRLNQAGEIVIYGAGQVAIDICTKLMNTGYWRKVACAVVTDEPEAESFMGLPLRRCDEAVPFKDSALVLVCVSKRYGAYGEIVDKLRKLRCKNYMDADELRYF